MSLTAEVTKVKDLGDAKMVTMEITSPKMFPNVMRETRARLVALRTVGIIDTVEDVTTDMISKRELKRMTTIRSNKETGDKDGLSVVRTIKVFVRNN